MLFLLFSSVFVLGQAGGVSNMQCQCALGYRNGASASSAELCMGPAENGKHPCYPSPCNADWNPCSQQSSQGSFLWRKESDHIGKRPVCDSNIDVTNGKNYRYQTLENCKQGCLETPRCDTISRYVYPGKTDTSVWHCWFYACGPQTLTEWEPQTSWGHGADKAVTHFLLTRGRTSTKIINKTINETRYIDKVRWTNETRYIDKVRWANKTRYTDKIRWINETRYIDKVRWINKTRYTDKIRWINETRYIDKVRWINETRYTDEIRWTNETRYIDKVRWINETRYTDEIRWINKTIHNMMNETRYVNETRYIDKIINKIVNQTRYIDKVRYVDVVNNTSYENTLGPAALPAADITEQAIPEDSDKTSDECDDWDTRDYTLIVIIAVVAVAWCIKETCEFFECRIPKNKPPVRERDLFPDAELPPMAWEVKVEDIVKD